MQENVILNYLMQGDSSGLVNSLEQALGGLRSASSKIANIQDSLNKKIADEELKAQRKLGKALIKQEKSLQSELTQLARKEASTRKKILADITAGRLDGNQLRKLTANGLNIGKLIEGSVSSKEGVNLIKQRVSEAITKAFSAARTDAVARTKAARPEIERLIFGESAANVSRFIQTAQNKIDGELTKSRKKFTDSQKAERLKNSILAPNNEERERALRAFRQLDESVESQRQKAAKKTLDNLNREGRQIQNQIEANAKKEAESKRKIRDDDAARTIKKAEDTRKAVNKATASGSSGIVSANGQTFFTPAQINAEKLASRGRLAAQKELANTDRERAGILRALVATGREERKVRGEIGLLSGKDRQDKEAQLASIVKQRNSLKEIASLHKINSQEIRRTIRDLNPPDNGNSFFGNITRLFATGLLLRGIQSVASAVTDLLGRTVATSAEFQKLETSFVSILAEPLTEKIGITPENLAQLRIESKKLFQEAQIAAVQTVATTKEYVALLQTSLAVGQNIGLTQEQILILTKRFALAGGAFGIEFEKISTSIAQIFTGSVRSTNQLGRNLGLATEEQRKLLRDALKSGKLFEFLERKTRGFAATAGEVQDNFVNVLAAIQDIFQLGGAAAIKPFFDTLNKELIAFRDRFFTGNDLQPFRKELLDIIEQVRDFINAILPNLSLLGKTLLTTVGSFFSALTGQSGVSAINVILRILIGLLSTLNQLFSNPSVKTFVTVITLATIALKILAIQSLATTPIIGGLGLAFSNLGAAIGLLTTARGAANIFAGIQLAASAAIPVIGLVVAALGVLSVAYFSMSDSTDKASEAQDRFSRSLQKVQEAINGFIDQSEILKNALDLLTLSNVENRTADQQVEFERLFSLVVRLAPQAAAELQQFGKLSATGLEDLRNGAKRASADIKALRDDIENALAGDILERFVKNTNKLKEIQESGNLTTLAGRGSVATAARKEAAELQKSLNEDIEIIERLNLRTGQTTEQLIAGGDAIKQYRVKLEESLSTLNTTVPAIEFQTLTLKEQIVVVGDLAVEIKKLDEQLANSNLTTTERTRLDEERNAKQREATLISRFFTLSLEAEARAQGITTQELIKNTIQLLNNDKQKIQSRLETERKTKADLDAAFATAILNGTIGDNISLLLAQARASAAAISKDEAALKLVETQIGALQAKIGKPAGKPAATGGKGGSKPADRARDEFSDFIKKTDAQLQLLKKIGDDIEKEIDRFVDIRLKLIDTLTDTQVINNEVGTNTARDLVIEQFNIATELLEQRRAFIKKNLEISRQIVDDQNARQAKENARTNKKGKLFGFNKDTRDRAEEAVIKFNSELLDIEKSRTSALRKAEETLQQLGVENAKRELARVQLLREHTQELGRLKRELDTQLTEVQEKQGKIGTAVLLQKQFEEREIQRQKERANAQRILSPTDSDFNELAGKLNAAKGLVLSYFNDISNDSAKQAAFAPFKSIIDKANLVAAHLAELNRQQLDKSRQIDATTDRGQKIRLQSQKDALGDAIKRRREQLELLLDEIQAKLGTGVFDEDAANLQIEIGRALEFIRSLLPDIAKQKDAELTIAKSQNETEKDRIELAEKFRELKLKEVELYRQIAEFELNRLDAQQAIINRQVELGRLTEEQGRRQEASLIRQKIAQIEFIKVSKEAALAREIADARQRTIGAAFVGASGRNPEADQRLLDALGGVNEARIRLGELKDTLFELESVTRATANGLRLVGDVLAGLSGPNERLAKLAPVFTGLAKLLDIITNNKAAKTPAENLLSASERFKEDTFAAADKFKELAKFIETLIPPGQRAQTPGGGSGGGATTPKANEIIGIASKVAAGLIGGLLGGGDAGQKIGGVGAAAGGLSGLGKFFKAGSGAAKFLGALGPIGAAAEIVGGFVSFFGSVARAKTAKLAETLQAGINDLKEKIASGAITLGQGIAQLQAKLEDARRQLSGRKGGKEELKKIEDDIKAQQKALRDQAKTVQDEFRKSLEVLRQPKELRDTIAAIEEIRKKVTEFLNSFENPSDALNALGEAQEFVKRSIKELSDEIQKNLDSLQDDLSQATKDFQKSQRDILQEGRANPVVSEIISKRQRLNELAEEFKKRQKELTDQINGERKKLDFVNERKNLELEIAKLVGQSANALQSAAQAFSSALQSARGFQVGAGGGGSGTVLNITVNGAGSDGRQIGVEIAEHLRRAGFVSPSRLSQFNPV